MLTEERYSAILDLLEEKRNVTVTEIKDMLGISESTVRRDLNALDHLGRLHKVFGGAVSIEARFTNTEPSMAQKQDVNVEEKRKIARYAASLIKSNDFVYLDAGTTTGYMIDFLTDTSVTFATNAVLHAKRLAAAGFQVLVLGGILKGSTEAVIGSHTVLSLQKMHFSKGFFGTNGVSRKCGLSTPDTDEALVKQTALGQCRESYVLADYEKFGKISLMTFAGCESTKIITDRRPSHEFSGAKNIIIA